MLKSDMPLFSPYFRFEKGYFENNSNVAPPYKKMQCSAFWKGVEIEDF